MRPRLVEFLEPVVGSFLARFLVPTGVTMLAAAVAVVLWVMVIRGRRVGLSPRWIVAASLCGVLAGLLGARAFHLLQHLPRTLANPHLVFRLAGGTTSWGAYLGGLLGFGLCLAVRRRPVLPHLDLLASCLGLGPLLARWSCFLNGCCFGRVTDLPWGVRFPAPGFVHQAQRQAGLIDLDAPLTLPVHPVQLYASLAGLLLFAATSRFWAARRERPGRTFAFYWLLYGLLRFGIEFGRGDVPRLAGTGLTLSQLICLGVVLLAGGFLAAGAGAQKRNRSPAVSGKP